MKNWMPDASERFESYKGRVRLAVAGNPTVDADDVLQDIQAHVDAELGPTSGPVTLLALERVLESLGSPAQWEGATSGGAEAEPGVSMAEHARRFAARWETRLAGDWGSPVLLAVVTLAGLVTIETIGVLLLALAYFMGRGLLRHSSPPLTGARGTMALVPVALIAALLVGFAVATPLLIMGRASTTRALMGLGSWWILLGFAASREAERVRSALYPFADWFESTHARLLMLIGAGLLALGFLNQIT
jgi:hypothetical protein